ncbi:conserved domain protein [delta proteobacterium NaphS2]|nr:conserved domain protein [delta proteobacterium NaphS2]
MKDESLLIYGALLAEPPALLEAFAERLRAGDLNKLRILSSLPLVHAPKTVLAADLVDCVERCSTFVGAGDRGLVHVGLNDYLPNHLHQLPKLISEYMTVDVAATRRCFVSCMIIPPWKAIRFHTRTTLQSSLKMTT